jgi:putative Mg2+ transporter-C (MgtC) family protein
MSTEITYLYVFQAIGLTMLFVGFIGYERERKHKIAGLTTHILVGLGAVGVTLVQELLVQDSLQFIMDNPSLAQNIVVERQRVIAQIITGVGFLGAGAILKTRNNIYGLTTASSLWVSAVIGIIFGLGYFLVGVIVSMAALLTLTIVKRILGKEWKDEEFGNRE